MRDGHQQRLRSFREGWLKWGIPALGVFLAVSLVGIAIAIAPDDDTQGGFRIRAEVVKASLTFAVAIFTGAVVSFLIPEYGRRVDARKDRALERRRLVGELRDVHHAVKTAALRIKAHRTVRTYGSEIRDVIMPKVAQLGGVISDVKAQQAQMFSENDARAIENQVGQAKSYLERLTNEFEDKYLPASLFQEAHYKWRQHHVGKLANSDTPPTSEDLRKTSVADERVWDYIASKQDNDEFRFPRLAVLLELQGAAADESDHHRKQFSEPIREAMNIIERVWG